MNYGGIGIKIKVTIRLTTKTRVGKVFNGVKRRVLVKVKNKNHPDLIVDFG